jgi:4-aminobutyrate aminotransferase-like enzyme/Ser/Thr protein kinase RdoA (MazF antagonist)
MRVHDGADTPTYPPHVADHPVDPVLTAAVPSFTDAEAVAIARDTFGVDGVARSLGSERDQTFLVDGTRPAILKISNAAEDVARLDMEALAVQRIALVDPHLPVALPWRVPRSSAADDDPSAYRAELARADGIHHARMYDRLPGRASVQGATMSDRAVRDWGTMAARVGRALRGFWHPAARRVMLWDPQHAHRLRPMLAAVTQPAIRELVERALDRFEVVVVPAWPSLRAQVIHTDLCTSNVLVDDEGTVTGIIDFGDTSHTALVVDAVTVVESLVAGREGDEVFRTARIAIDGFERVTPLEPGERAIFGELLAARACAAVVVPAWRAALYEDGGPPQPELFAEGVALLELIQSTGWDEVARRLGGRQPGSGRSLTGLAEERRRLFGPAVTGLSYRTPLHVVRGEGVWLIDADGRRYLDAYNNVPVVGHEHPRVVEATVRQVRRLNTNVRYLHETALEVAERLIATTESGLDVVMFVNSGSEANDLAWRIATAVTGGSGGICTTFAYHGISEAITGLSPEDWEPAGQARPDHVRTWSPPDPYRGMAASPDAFAAAIEELRGAGHRPAAAILDGLLTSDGILDLEPAFVEELVRLTQDAGALWIADEVQGGHGRTGEAMWSYQRHGIVPDIVTLGKPMGNGHPVAAVVTRQDLAEGFARTTDLFSTFGGNPVAVAAALAVLEVIDDERTLDNTRTVGAYLLARLREIAGRFERIGDVRGIGLMVGVEVVRPGTTEPDPPTARAIVNGLRDREVLIGTTGRAENILKIRPPLVFQPAHADLLVTRLNEVLADLDGG